MEVDKRVFPDPQNGEIEVQEPQQTPEGEATPENATIDVEELKHRAEISSQNFERAKKAEVKIKELQNLIEKNPPVVVDDDLSDEGRMLKDEILSLKDKLSSYEKSQEEMKIYNKYPELNDKKEEFNEYHSENSNLSLEQAAKLFRLERGLNEKSILRKGLEKPTAGMRDISVEPTPEDLERKRTAYSHKEYLKLYGPTKSRAGD